LCYLVGMGMDIMMVDWGLGRNGLYGWCFLEYGDTCICTLQQTCLALYDSEISKYSPAFYDDLWSSELSSWHFYNFFFHVSG
jgi:hypothetical protein